MSIFRKKSELGLYFDRRHFIKKFPIEEHIKEEHVKEESDMNGCQ